VTSQPDPWTSRGRSLCVLVGALVAAVALVLSGCSSSGSGSTSTGAPQTSAASSSAGSSGSSASGGSGGSEAAAAQAFVAKYSQRPTKIPITTKVGKPVPKGKTIYFISCGTPECAEESDIIKTATDALGWTLHTINTDGTPETEKSAFDQATRAKPAGILYTAIDKSVFASDIPTLHSSGGILSACCITDPVGPTSIDYAVEIPSQTGFVGQLQAAWVGADSGGNAHTVFVNIPSIPILTFAETQYKAKLPSFCSNCSYDKLDIPITALGKDVPQRVVSYLRAHTDVKYVVMSTDSLAIGLPAALKAAGMNDIKIVGQGATATNLEYLHTNQQAVSVAFPFYESMFMMVDAVVRHEAGVPILPSVTPPQWLLTPQNAPSTSKIFPIVPDVVKQFEALWGVSGG
jgi:ribose transport system substrate-binding protein